MEAEFIKEREERMRILVNLYIRLDGKRKSYNEQLSTVRKKKWGESVQVARMAIKKIKVNK